MITGLRLGPRWYAYSICTSYTILHTLYCRLNAEIEEAEDAGDEAGAEKLRSTRREELLKKMRCSIAGSVVLIFILLGPRLIRICFFHAQLRYCL
jgi:hypothetical protein